MPWKAFILSIAFLIILAINFGSPDLPPNEINKLYHRADSLLNLSNPTPATNQAALEEFERVIGKLEKNIQPDQGKLLFLSYLKKGILLDIQSDYNGAKNAYCKALDIGKSNKAVTDSLNLMVYVNTGASYYNLNNFDSANYFLLRAESRLGQFASSDDKIRLYNTLGVLYYDNGNYLQSKNYFKQGLEIVKNKRPLDTISAVSIETNMATSFYRLGKYDGAIDIYKKILKYHMFTDYIYLNMGRANTGLNKYEEALACFRKVNANVLPWVYNEIGYTELKLNKPDSAAYFLDRMRVIKDKNKLNVLDIGINDSYRAELLTSLKKCKDALDNLQKAIIIFSGNFRDENIFSNPANFVGSFAYYRLFDVLLKKAETFEALYRETAKEEYLLASFSTYQTTLSLLDYIEKSYDTDDAKILLKKKSRNAYEKALTVCIELYQLHHQNKFLEQAFNISEKNKASIIASNLKERTFINIPGIKEELLEKERNIKYNLARLDIESDRVLDSSSVDSISDEKARYEIELSRLQKSFEQNNHYYKLKYDNLFPSVQELQKHLGSHQALISFYTAGAILHSFVLTQTSFSYLHYDSLSLLKNNVTEWLSFLKITESGRKFKGEKTGLDLYEQLIRPIQTAIPDKDEWIIIPDGILYFLPFESLPANGNEHTLLETTAISYQYSSRFMINNPNDHPDNFSYRVLSFAPFVLKGGNFNQRGSLEMSRLPASGEEIAGLDGKSYIDSAATKENFLSQINKYPIVHLATHAMSDVNNSAASFIAFYPEKKSFADDCLFLEELYGLNMDSTQLVIISACETGKGELVNNEGVISLSRAFLYAGCASTINSLWKADDEATSAILRQFHIYLEKGYSKVKALQLAKLDFIRNHSLMRSPNYWAHLVLIGNTDPMIKNGSSYLWAVVFGSSLFTLFVIALIAKKKNKSRRFPRIKDFKSENVI